jgi:hypothetical protein
MTWLSDQYDRVGVVPKGGSIRDANVPSNNRKT